MRSKVITLTREAAEHRPGGISLGNIGKTVLKYPEFTLINLQTVPKRTMIFLSLR